MLTKIQIRTTTGTHDVAISREERAAIERSPGVMAMVKTTGDLLGRDKDTSGRLMFNVDGAGWVVFNPAHIVSIAFVGTEDDEL